MAGYWRSTAGVRHKRLRRFLRTARAVVAQEPRGKKAGRRDAEEFRRLVREQVAHLGVWPRPRAPLAVDLHFKTAARQPPRLDKLPKNYLGLLGTGSQLVADPGPVLYRDDRVVKMLFVSCRHEWDPHVPPEDPQIRVTARTRVDALLDIALASQVAYLLDLPVVEDVAILGRDRSEVDDELEREEIQHLRQRHDAASRSLLLMTEQFAKRRNQETYLANNDELLRATVFGFSRELFTSTSNLEPLLLAPRNLLLRGFTHLTLPGLPRAVGDNDAFEQAVSAVCEQFVHAHPVLFPLLVPLRLTVLVIPPTGGHRTDLDNLAMKIVGAVDAHLRPPVHPPTFLGPVADELARLADGTDDNAAYQEILEQERRRQARLKSLGETALWAYQAIELNRRPDDSPNGLVVLIPGHGMNHDSLWDEADQFLFDHFDLSDDELGLR